MEERVGDPGPEGAGVEKEGSLTEFVELWVAVQGAGGDVLVEHTDGERLEDGEEDVVGSLGPGFY